MVQEQSIVEKKRGRPATGRADYDKHRYYTPTGVRVGRPSKEKLPYDKNRYYKPTGIPPGKKKKIIIDGQEYINDID